MVSSFWAYCAIQNCNWVATKLKNKAGKYHLTQSANKRKRVHEEKKKKAAGIYQTFKTYLSHLISNSSSDKSIIGIVPVNCQCRAGRIFQFT